MNVGFRLCLYLDYGAILCRLESICASFEAHLDVIGPPNGAPKRLGHQNGAGKLPGLKIVIFGGQQAAEKYSRKACFSDNVPKLLIFWACDLQVRFLCDFPWIPGPLTG